MRYWESEFGEASTALPRDFEAVHTGLHLYECRAVETYGDARGGCMNPGTGWNRATILAQQPNGGGFSYGYIHQHAAAAEGNRMEGCGWHIS